MKISEIAYLQTVGKDETEVNKLCIKSKTEAPERWVSMLEQIVTILNSKYKSIGNDSLKPDSDIEIRIEALKAKEETNQIENQPIFKYSPEQAAKEFIPIVTNPGTQKQWASDVPKRETPGITTNPRITLLTTIIPGSDIITQNNGTVSTSHYGMFGDPKSSKS